MLSSPSAACWVSPESGYWAWGKREPSARARAEAHLTQRIVAIHDASRRTSGVPRIPAELASAGTRCERQRVARLMRRAGVQGCHRRRPFHTTRWDARAQPAPDLVRRTFSASAPNELSPR
jgi:putative transposase